MGFLTFAALNKTRFIENGPDLTWLVQQSRLNKDIEFQKENKHFFAVIFMC